MCKLAKCHNRNTNVNKSSQSGSRHRFGDHVMVGRGFLQLPSVAYENNSRLELTSHQPAIPHVYCNGQLTQPTTNISVFRYGRRRSCTSMFTQRWSSHEYELAKSYIANITRMKKTTPARTGASMVQLMLQSVRVSARLLVLPLLPFASVFL